MYSEYQTELLHFADLLETNGWSSLLPDRSDMQLTPERFQHAQATARAGPLPVLQTPHWGESGLCTSVTADGIQPRVQA